MPRGTAQDETGYLNAAARGGFILRRDGGGTWRLDIDPAVKERLGPLVGRRVRVRGMRAEFDLIDVTHIEPAR